MKRLLYITFIILILLSTVLGIVHYHFGLFTPYNHLSAQKDLNNETIQIIIYGELRKNEQLEAKIAAEYGFTYFGTGCLVTKPVINGIKYYNNLMYKTLDELNGEGWMADFEKERLENNLDC